MKVYKKKIFLITLLSILFIISSIYSQSSWFVQQSGTVNNLRSVFFLDAQTGWAVGDSGRIVKTTNGGTNWAINTSGTIYGLNAVKFFNNQTGWAVGGGYNMSYEETIIIKSTNGGNSWIVQFNEGGYNIFYDLHIINESTLFCVNGGANWWQGYYSEGNIFKSTNGGSIWLSYYPLHYNAFTSISFINSNTGWIGGIFWTDTYGQSEQIYKTTNMGVNWYVVDSVRIYLGGSNLYYKQKVRFVDLSNGYLLQNYMKKSTNGGLNWFNADSSGTLNASNYFFINKDTGWITTATNIKRTNNGGLNWSTQNTPVTSFKSIFFVNSLTGWAVGNNGIIVKTVTGGMTGIKSDNNIIPEKYSLLQNYPNPFNPTTNIKFQVASLKFIRLVVFDILGKEVAVLVNEKLQPGEYEITFDGSAFPSGVYFYKLLAGEYTKTKKMLMIK